VREECKTLIDRAVSLGLVLPQTWVGYADDGRPFILERPVPDRSHAEVLLALVNAGVDVSVSVRLEAFQEGGTPDPVTAALRSFARSKGRFRSVSPNISLQGLVNPEEHPPKRKAPVITGA
jgi:hypothetical protein